MKKLLLLTVFFTFLFSSCGEDDGNYESGVSGTSSTRCAATTKDGTRCKRNADKGSIYCWQHKK